jgi:hypothetical protein
VDPEGGVGASSFVEHVSQQLEAEIDRILSVPGHWDAC